MATDGAERKTFLEQNEDELKELGKAVGAGNRASIATAGAALFVKVLTGSPIAVSAVESAAKSFGAWVADTADARLARAAQAVQESERAKKRDVETLRRFAVLVEPIVLHGLQSLRAELGRVELGQLALHSTGKRVLSKQDDLEYLMAQSLRSTGLLAEGQNKIRATIDELHGLLQRLAHQQQGDTARRSEKFRLYGVPPLPFEFVDRPALTELKRNLVPMEGATSVIADRPVHAFYGMSGVGKTTLACAFARDPDVRRAFPDGVYWFALGEKPEESLVLLSRFVAALSGATVTFDTELQAKVRAQELLAERACLLVLDDVWEARHAAVFQVLGEHSKMLLTTRKLDVYRALGAHEHRLSELSGKDALEFLARYARLASHQLPSEAAEIAHACGELPLALAMVGALLRGRPRDRWTTMHARLRAAPIERLNAALPHYRHESFAAAISISIEDLPADPRERYLAFSVFPADTGMPEATLALYWNVDRAEAQDTIDMFVDRSLARLDAEQRVVLHDLQRDFIRTRTTNLTALHKRLVEAYRRAGGGVFFRIEADGYIYDHFAWHFRQAEGSHALRALLLDVRWLNARLLATDVNGVLMDFELLELEQDRPARWLRDAVGLSAHVLRRRPEELLIQLAGRLHGCPEPELDALVRATLDLVAPPALLPTLRCLQPPGGPLLRTFEGHADTVTSVALSADGTLALSGSSDMTLKLWDTRSGELLHTFEGHDGRVTSVALSADGTLALSGSNDMTLRLWDAHSGALLRTLEGHADAVYSVALSADGSHALSGSSDMTLKLWDTRSGELLRTFEGHTHRVESVALSADGTRALSGSSDAMLKLWDTRSGELLQTFERHAHWATSTFAPVALSADGMRALSGSGGEAPKLWDTRSGELLRTFEGHSNVVFSVGLSADGSRALSGSGDMTLKLWDTRNGELLRTFEGHAYAVCSGALSPDGTLALSGSDDMTLRLWDARGGEILRAFAGHANAVYSVALSADGTRALSGSHDETLKLWDTRNGELLRTIEGHVGPVYSVALSADGTRALSGSHDETLKLWDTRSGALLQTFEGHAKGVSSVALSADGSRALSGSGDATLKLWDARSGELLRTLEGHAYAVYSVALSADGTRALSGSEDKTLRLWDTRNGDLLRTFEDHTDEVVSVALSADGARALSGSSDETLKLWDTRSGELLWTFTGRAGRVASTALSADGRSVLLGSEDKTLQLWDTSRARQLSSVSAPDARFTAEAMIATVAIAQNGSFALAGDVSGAIYALEIRCLAPARSERG